MKFLLLSLIAWSLFAEEPPKLSSAQIIAYFKTRAENAEAQAIAAQKAAAYNAALGEMLRACQSALVIDDHGMPMCQSVSPPPETAKPSGLNSSDPK
jgi:hypothetical protein